MYKFENMYKHVGLLLKLFFLKLCWSFINSKVQENQLKGNRQKKGQELDY